LKHLCRLLRRQDLALIVRGGQGLAMLRVGVRVRLVAVGLSRLREQDQGAA